MKPQKYYNTYQLKLPVDLERILEISDPVYTFCEVLDSIDLCKYLVEKEHKTGRPRYDSYTLLRVILFAFMENGYRNALRRLVKAKEERRIEAESSANIRLSSPTTLISINFFMVTCQSAGFFFDNELSSNRAALYGFYLIVNFMQSVSDTESPAAE